MYQMSAGDRKPAADGVSAGFGESYLWKEAEVWGTPRFHKELSS